MKKINRVSHAAGVSALGVLALAAPAHADAYVSTNSYGGHATWIELGDILTVCDDEADG